jgi:uncharacterized Zn finger protein
VKHFGPCGGDVIRKEEWNRFVYGCKECGHIWEKRKRGAPAASVSNAYQDPATNYNMKTGKQLKRHLHQKVIKGHGVCMGDIERTVMLGIIYYKCTRCGDAWNQSIKVSTKGQHTVRPPIESQEMVSDMVSDQVPGARQFDLPGPKKDFKPTRLWDK